MRAMDLQSINFFARYDSYGEFVKMRRVYQVVAITISLVVGLLTLTTKTETCFNALVGRFRKIEEDLTAQTVSRVASAVIYQEEPHIIEEFIKALFNPNEHQRFSRFETLFRNFMEDQPGQDMMETIEKSFPTLAPALKIQSNREKLFSFLMDQAQIDPNLEKRSTFTPSTTVIGAQTLGDGSCAFHAILGDRIDGIYRVTDAAKVRKEYCDWLRKDENFKYVSIGFAEFQNNPPSHIKDPSKESYLAHMEKVGTFILQDELLAIAKCFNMKVTLYQQEWGDDNKMVGTRYNSEGQTAVHIVYVNFIHYERVENPSEGIPVVDNIFES